LQELLTLHKNIAAIVSTDCWLSFDAKHIFSKPTAQQEMNTGTYAADKTNKVIYMIFIGATGTDFWVPRHPGILHLKSPTPGDPRGESLGIYVSGKLGEIRGKRVQPGNQQ